MRQDAEALISADMHGVVTQQGHGGWPIAIHCHILGVTQPVHGADRCQVLHGGGRLQLPADHRRCQAVGGEDADDHAIPAPETILIGEHRPPGRSLQVDPGVIAAGDANAQRPGDQTGDRHQQ